MPDPPANLVKAYFETLTPAWTVTGDRIPVQFNPETLKVSYANQIVEPSSGGSKKGPTARQFLGAGTTKLSLTLWFDVTSPPYASDVMDVRDLTAQISFFVTPTPSTLANQKDNTQFHPSPVRFQWGSFAFDGLMDSLEESLEFFGPNGNALRASLAVSMSRQKTTPVSNSSASQAPTGGAGPATGPGGQPPGTAPLTAASAGASVQNLADQQGVGANWQSIAAANGIENPRMLVPGALVDLNARVGVGAGAGASLGVSGSFGVGVAGGVDAGLSVGGGVGAVAGLGAVGGGIAAGGSFGLGASFGVGASLGAGAGAGVGASAGVSASLGASVQASASLSGGG